MSPGGPANSPDGPASSPGEPAGASRRRALLGASLALNVLLAAGLWAKAADTRAHYWARLTAPASPTTPPSPTDRALLGSPPPLASPIEAELAAVRPAHAHAGQAGAAFGPWRAGLTGALASALGRPEAGDVQEARLVARDAFPAVVREKHYLRLPNGVWLPAWLLTPKAGGGRRPAVLALPGHDAPQAAWGRGAADVADAAKPGNYMGGFGMKLAEAGFVVLAVDVSGVGELAGLGYTDLARRGLLAGTPLAGRMASEARAALGWLRARPGVDPARVGVAGLSLGGMLALYVAALDPQVAFAADAGYFLSYRDLPGVAAEANFVPGVLRVADLPDVAGAIAPRPLLVQADPADPVAPPKDLDALAARTAGIYRAAGAPAAFTLQRHGKGHAMDVPALVGWLTGVTGR